MTNPKEPQPTKSLKSVELTKRFCLKFNGDDAYIDDSVQIDFFIIPTLQ